MKHKIELLVPCEVVKQPVGAHRSMAKLMSTKGDFVHLGPQPDLLFMRSLLVSTGSNKNDDVFLPDEMWKARSTPILKPVDWEHNTGRELSEDEQLQNPGKVPVKIIEAQVGSILKETDIVRYEDVYGRVK